MIGLSHDAKESIHGYIHEVEAAENRLLELASQPQNLNNGWIEALEIKAYVLAKRKQFDSAIFYLERALQSTNNVRIRESLAALYLDVSMTRKENKAIDSSDYYEIANRKIKKLPSQSLVRWDLSKHMNQLNIEELTKSEPDLIELKRLLLEFESIQEKRNIRETTRDEFIRIVVSVIGESKRVLDASINYIKEVVYCKSSNKSRMCYYPSPTALKNRLPNATPETQMDDLFDKVYKLPGFKRKFPTLFTYLVERQPSKNADYDWLQRIIDIRNTNEHQGLQVTLDSLEISFPYDEEKVELVRKMSKYAAEVRLFVGRCINDPKHTYV